MCTNLTFNRAAGADTYSARTLDFSFPIITTVGRANAGDDIELLSGNRKAEYGFVGASFEETKFFYEGLNSAGLSAAFLWMPGSVFPTAKSYPNKSTAVQVTELIGLILGCYNRVSDLHHDLSEKGDMYVTFDLDNAVESLQEFVKASGQPTLTVHLVVTDETNDSMVVEFVDGFMSIYYHNEPVYGDCTGVLVNAPFYDFHLNNLNSYSRMGVKNDPWHDNGSGMFGIPGDATSPSRFLMASKLRDAAFYPDDQPNHKQNQTVQVLRLIERMNVPIGSIEGPGQDHSKTWCPGDYTQWLVVRDHAARAYYIMIYNDPTLFRVDLDGNWEAASWCEEWPEKLTTWYNALKPVTK